jgi:hypothetical protein
MQLVNIANDGVAKWHQPFKYASPTRVLECTTVADGAFRIVSLAMTASRCFLSDSPPSSQSPATDRALIDACLAGSSQAWDELYQICQDKLLASICRYLGPKRGQGLELADEVSARVWYAMVRNEGALLDRFDPRLGARITTFFSVIAKDMLFRLYRSESRRGRREAVFVNGRRATSSPNLSPLILEEIRDSLTPSERRFYDEVLMAGRVDASSVGYSPTNAWQLSSRIYRKVHKEFEED